MLVQSRAPAHFESCRVKKSDRRTLARVPTQLLYYTICIYIYIYIYTHICIYISLNIHVCIQIYIYIYTHTYICMCAAPRPSQPLARWRPTAPAMRRPRPEAPEFYFLKKIYIIFRCIFYRLVYIWSVCLSIYSILSVCLSIYLAISIKGSAAMRRPRWRGGLGPSSNAMNNGSSSSVVLSNIKRKKHVLL